MGNQSMWRTAMMLGMLSGMLSGCASMKSIPLWPSSKTPVASDPMAGSNESSGLMSTFNNTTKGIGGQFRSMGSAVSSAYSKTKRAVTAPFSRADENADPTSLSNMPSPDSLGPEIWVTNGQLYESQGNFEKALDNYTKALELEPGNEAALLSTANLYARQELHPQAEAFFQKALEVRPQAATYNSLGLACKEQGKVPEAESAIRKAIELDVSNPLYRNNLAGLLVSTGRSDDAVQELESVFGGAVANYNVAFLNVKNNNVAAAQQHLASALRLNPDLEAAKNLMKQIGSSPTAQTAMAAYQTAGDVYRTAEAIASPTVDANRAVYQLPSSKLPATTSLPTATSSQPNFSNLPALPR